MTSAELFVWAYDVVHLKSRLCSVDNPGGPLETQQFGELQ